MNLTLDMFHNCHLSTHEISSQYLEQSFAPDIMHTKRAITLETDKGGLWTFRYALVLIHIYLSMNFQDNILQG